MKTKIKYVYLSLLILITTTIFVFSSFSGSRSSAQSGFIANTLIKMLGWVNVTLQEQQAILFASIIRKLLGHFLLFLIEGVFMFLTLVSFKDFKNKWYGVLFSFLIVVLVAFLSEGIQFFADSRGPALKDVLINSAGALLGIAITFLIVEKPFKRAQKTDISPEN